MTKLGAVPVVVLLCLAASPARAEQAGQARVDAASRAYATAEAALAAGATTPDDVYQWSVRRLVAELDAGPARARRAALEGHLQRMRDLQQRVGTMVSSGSLPAAATAACEYYVAEAQVWVSRRRGP